MDTTTPVPTTEPTSPALETIPIPKPLTNPEVIANPNVGVVITPGSVVGAVTLTSTPTVTPVVSPTTTPAPTNTESPVARALSVIASDYEAAVQELETLAHNMTAEFFDTWLKNNIDKVRAMAENDYRAGLAEKTKLVTAPKIEFEKATTWIETRFTHIRNIL